MKVKLKASEAPSWQEGRVNKNWLAVCTYRLISICFLELRIIYCNYCWLSCLKEAALFKRIFWKVLNWEAITFFFKDMFKDYKSNYCPQARMSNYVKLWLKTAQLSVSSLGGSCRSRAHVAWPGKGVAPQQRWSPAGTRDRHGRWTWDHKKAGKNRWKREKGKKLGREWKWGTVGTKLALLSPWSLSTSQPDACGEELALDWGNGHTDPSGASSCPVSLCFSSGSPSRAAREKYAFIFQACLLTPTPLCSSANVWETSSGLKGNLKCACTHKTVLFL